MYVYVLQIHTPTHVARARIYVQNLFHIIHKAHRISHHTYTHTSHTHTHQRRTFPQLCIVQRQHNPIWMFWALERGAGEQYLPSTTIQFDFVTTNRPVLHCENHHGRCADRFLSVLNQPPTPSFFSSLSLSPSPHSHLIYFSLSCIHSSPGPYECCKLKMNTKQTMFNCISWVFFKKKKKKSYKSSLHKYKINVIVCVCACSNYHECNQKHFHRFFDQWYCVCVCLWICWPKRIVYVYIQSQLFDSAHIALNSIT